MASRNKLLIPNSAKPIKLIQKHYSWFQLHAKQYYTAHTKKRSRMYFRVYAIRAHNKFKTLIEIHTPAKSNYRNGYISILETAYPARHGSCRRCEPF